MRCWLQVPGSSHKMLSNMIPEDLLYAISRSVGILLSCFYQEKGTILLPLLRHWGYSVFTLLDIRDPKGTNAPKEEEPARETILPFWRSIAPGLKLFHIMEQLLFWQKRYINKHLFGVISGSWTLICRASATTSGTQLHITHGFLLIRIEWLGVDRINPLVNTALIKAALHQLQHWAEKVGSSLAVDSLGQGEQGKWPGQVMWQSWRWQDGTESLYEAWVSTSSHIYQQLAEHGRGRELNKFLIN